MALPIQLTTLTTIAARKAAPKLWMPMPGRKAATRPSMAAFTTSRNRPRVSSVNGSVSRTAIGLMIALTTPSRSAARISVVGLETLMPSIHSVASQRPSAAISVRRMKRVTGALWPVPRRFSQSSRRIDGLANAPPALDDNVDGLQQSGIAKYIAADGDDVRDFPGRERAGLVADTLCGRGIVSRRLDGAQRRDAALPHPEIDLLPGRT